MRLPAGSFLQATRPTQRALTEIVSDIVGPGRLVADLFGGDRDFCPAAGTGKGGSRR